MPETTRNASAPSYAGAPRALPRAAGSTAPRPAPRRPVRDTGLSWSVCCARRILHYLEGSHAVAEPRPVSRHQVRDLADSQMLHAGTLDLGDNSPGDTRAQVATALSGMNHDIKNQCSKNQALEGGRPTRPTTPRAS